MKRKVITRSRSMKRAEQITLSGKIRSGYIALAGEPAGK